MNLIYGQENFNTTPLTKINFFISNALYFSSKTYIVKVYRSLSGHFLNPFYFLFIGYSFWKKWQYY